MAIDPRPEGLVNPYDIPQQAGHRSASTSAGVVLAGAAGMAVLGAGPAMADTPSGDSDRSGRTLVAQSVDAVEEWNRGDKMSSQGTIELQLVSVGVQAPFGPGTEGYAVERVQQMLQVRPVDGVFGAGTERAVRGFQERHNLPSDGVVGPSTARVLLNPTQSQGTYEPGTPWEEPPPLTYH